MSTAAKRIVIAAGGTGGHMFPAQALGETLLQRGWDVSMMTDARGRPRVEWLDPDRVFTVQATSVSPRKPLQALRGVATLAKGVRTAKRIMGKNLPNVVAGFGGYPAFPAIRAAQQMGIPTVLHEQNTVLGRVNRVFARRAVAVASGFEELRRLPGGATHVVTGNPLREQIWNAVPEGYSAPGDGDIHLLVVGGSLGARIIARTVPKAVAALPKDLRKRLVVVQQTTEGELLNARATYEQAGVRATCEPFFGDIQNHLAKAHLVIARAGASSVSEIAAMGLPSILVPLAIAMDDHQTVNASSLERLGAAIVLPETGFTPEALQNVLGETLDDGVWLENAARAARSVSRPDATHDLADLVTRAAG